MENKYDAIIVGGGPAGLTAALYLARAKYRVLVMEKDKFGGQITITSEIVNYPGVKMASGLELTETMRKQAEDFGAEFVIDEAIEIKSDKDEKIIITAAGKEYRTLGITLAIGASPRKLGFAGEKEFQGRGVAYCATCDGEFFEGREILVIGGGFAAVEESMFLTKYATKVIMFVITENYTCAAGTYEKLKDYPNIETRFQSEITEVGGEGVLTYARCRNNATGEEYIYQAKDGGPLGVFVFAGYEPTTDWLKQIVDLNEQGYIITDMDKKTSADGIYAAGDVCVKNLRQVVTAVGDGAAAATSLEHYISKKRDIAGTDEAHTLIDASMKKQLQDLFGSFSEKLLLAVVTNSDNEKNKKISDELSDFVRELDGIDSNVNITIEESGVETPYIDIRKNGHPSGIRYYSVPGGHELNSFVIALYNVAGKGREIDDELIKAIKSIRMPHKLQVMATLSCTNCPEVVMATQQLAAILDDVEAEMYDLSRFPDIKEKYNIMAVPCLIVDGKRVVFGKKSLKEITDIILEEE